MRKRIPCGHRVLQDRWEASYARSAYSPAGDAGKEVPFVQDCAEFRCGFLRSVRNTSAGADGGTSTGIRADAFPGTCADSGTTTSGPPGPNAPAGTVLGTYASAFHAATGPFPFPAAVPGFDQYCHRRASPHSRWHRRRLGAASTRRVPVDQRWCPQA